MNPCFRLFRLRQFDIRRASCSTATALKRQGHETVREEGLGSEYWSASNICTVYKRGKPQAAKPITEGKINYSKSNRVEHLNLITKSPHQLKLEFDQLLKQDCDQNTDKKIVSDKNGTAWSKQNSKGIRGHWPDQNIDFSQLVFLKDPKLSQKDKLPTDDNGISSRAYQNVQNDQSGPKTCDRKEKPTYVQLQKVADYYKRQLPAMHARTEDFMLGLHSEDIIFENNYTRIPASCQGLNEYRMALAKMRIIGNLCYTSFRFKYSQYSLEAMGCFRIGTMYGGEEGMNPLTITVVSIRCDMDQGAVILHWKLFYITNIGFFTKAAPRFLLTRKLENAFEDDDAISTFYVNGQGKIFKHKVDNNLKSLKRAYQLVPLTGEKVKAEGVLNRLRKKLTLANT